jgi:hypothetical protein
MSPLKERERENYLMIDCLYLLHILKKDVCCICYMASIDEHIIKCSICGRGLIVKDTVNNGVAFLSHLKLDHGIEYSPQLMAEQKTKKSVENQVHEALEFNYMPSEPHE